MARSSAGGGRGGGGRTGGRGSIVTVGRQQMNASHCTSTPSRGENGDDDAPAVHVASMRRASASQAQVPEQMDRVWISIEYGQFSKQVKVTRVIKSNLEAMWSGPWQGWKDVPKEDKDRLFERFQCYFQWEKKWNTKIYSCWESNGEKKGLQVGNDTSVLLAFKPPWMRMEPWKELTEIWNTPEWKEKSDRNKANINKSTGGKHTLGSQTFVTAKIEAAKKLGRELYFFEMWRQSHCKKGKRPLDKIQECTSTLVVGLDSEENVEEQNQDLDADEDVHEQNQNWVDERSFETWKTYDGYLKENYGEDATKHPFDLGLWSRAGGGKNKGKL